MISTARWAVRSPSVSSEPELQLTWVGHATVLAELGGVRLLTDPVLTGRVAHLRRHAATAAPEHVDAILISHVHMDHMHVPSLRLLPPTTTVIAPAGAGDLLTRRGFSDVHETRVGTTIAVGAVDVETVPAKHTPRRGPHSRVTAEAVGYVLRSSGQAVYFAGDTDLFDEMSAIAPVDVALLPIWGWGPTIGEGHLDPNAPPRRSGSSTLGWSSRSTGGPTARRSSGAGHRRGCSSPSSGSAPSWIASDSSNTSESCCPANGCPPRGGVTADRAAAPPSGRRRSGPPCASSCGG